MDMRNKGNPTIGGNSNDKEKPTISEAANKLLDEGKNFAHALYQDGLDKVEKSQESAVEFSNDLVKKVQKNPIASLLVAAGVGFLLSSILRKK